jgi:hypothetical protein
MKSDIWSFGVIMYSLLVGHFPWREGGIYETMTDIKTCSMRKSYKLSADAYDLLSKILTPVDKRIALQNIKQHPWIKNYVLPSYLEPRIPVNNIDCLIIDKIVSLGFDKTLTLSDIYDNNNTIRNAIYHIILNKYNKININNEIRFYKKNTGGSYTNDIRTPVGNIKFFQHPIKSSSSPIQQNIHIPRIRLLNNLAGSDPSDHKNSSSDPSRSKQTTYRRQTSSDPNRYKINDLIQPKSSGISNFALHEYNSSFNDSSIGETSSLDTSMGAYDKTDTDSIDYSSKIISRSSSPSPLKREEDNILTKTSSKKSSLHNLRKLFKKN